MSDATEPPRQPAMTERLAAETADRPAEVTVTFTLAPEDIARFARFTMWHLPGSRAQTVGYAAGIPVLLGAGALVVTRDWPLALAAAVIGGVVFVLSFGNSIAAATLRRARQSPDALTPQTITISPRGFHQTLWSSAGTIQWSGFRDILTGADCILFMRSARSAILVPRRAFASPAEADAFYELARQYWREASG